MSIYIWSRSSSWYLHWERSFGAEKFAPSFHCLRSFQGPTWSIPNAALICVLSGGLTPEDRVSEAHPCELYPSSLVTSVQSSHMRSLDKEYSVRCNSLLFLTIWKYTWLLCVIHWQTFPCIWKLAHLWCLIGICHAFEVNILESIAELKRVFNHTVMSVL